MDAGMPISRGGRWQLDGNAASKKFETPPMKSPESLAAGKLHAIWHFRVKQRRSGASARCKE
jgi:hypothetical protein